MLIKRRAAVGENEVTNPARRAFLRGGLLAASMVATGALYRGLLAPPRKRRPSQPLPEAQVAPPAAPSGAKPNSYEEITTYNNFYEFATDKYGPSERAAAFVTRPWTVAVYGLCAKPRLFDIDDLFRRFKLEERIYRLRCVEGWSMVIPWMGFPLRRLLELVEPLGSAKFVAFESLYDPERMPGQRRR